MSRIDWRQALAPGLYGLICVIALIFGHSAIDGDRGLQALYEARSTITVLEAELAVAEAERDEVANRVRRLSDGTIDLDLLDERARIVLGQARPDEILLRP
ncbi:MAG: septum formation initiator family protein [Pseudomonadota bacterium]